jgi:hypothetical protein
MRRDDLGTVDLIVEDSEIWTHSKMSDLLAISVRELEGLFLEQNPVPIVLSRITKRSSLKHLHKSSLLPFTNGLHICWTAVLEYDMRQRHVTQIYKISAGTIDRTII